MRFHILMLTTCLLPFADTAASADGTATAIAAIPLPQVVGVITHTGADWVKCGRYQMARAGAYGYDITPQINWGSEGMVDWNDSIAADRGWAYLFTGTIDSEYLVRLSVSLWDYGLAPEQGWVPLGAAETSMVFKRPADGSTRRLRWLPSREVSSLNNDSSGWVDIHSDEGVTVLRYREGNSNAGLRLVTMGANEVELGQILVAPNGPLPVESVSIRASSITVLLSAGDPAQAEVAHFSPTSSGWTQTARFSASSLGGSIVGLGDRRSVVRPTGIADKVWITRIDGLAPSVESVVTVPANLPTCTFAYARRGSLLISLAASPLSQPQHYYANREEPLPRCPGDLDGNGFVDGADLGIMLAHWGPCTP